MKTTKRIILSLCLISVMTGALQAQPATPAAAGSSPAAPSVPADPMALLKALPADASAFVAISNLHQLDTHVLGVVQQLQLAGMVPGPLEWLRSSTGLGRGLNENGSFAFVVLNLKNAKTPDEIGDKLVVYIPTANPDQLLQSLGGEKDGELTKITLMGQPTVAAPIKGFVVAAEKAETVKAALSAPNKGIDTVMSPDRVKAYVAQDIFAWADPRSLSKELRAQLRDGITGLMGKINPAAGLAAQSQPAGMQEAESFLDDLQEFTIGVSADSQRGLIVTWFGNPSEGSKMARRATTAKGIDGSLLTGLPKEPILVAYGMAGAAGDPEKAKQAEEFITQILNASSAGLSSTGIKIEQERLNTLKEGMLGLYTTMERFSTSLSGLPVEGGEGRLGVVMAAKVTDSKKWQADARKVFATLKQLVVDAAKKEGQAEDKIQPIADAIQWKTNAEQVEGATVDHFTIDLDKLPKAGDSEQAELEKAKAFLGKEGVLIRVAALSDNHVLVTFGGGAKRFAQVVELVRKNDASLADSAGIKSVAGRIPKGPRLIEGYLALDNLLDFVMSTAAQMGTPIPIPLALRNAAPIALTVTKVTPTACESQVLVPIELMVSVKELVGPIMMMMGGGMQPAPEGGAPPAAPKGELN